MILNVIVNEFFPREIGGDSFIRANNFLVKFNLFAVILVREIATQQREEKRKNNNNNRNKTIFSILKSVYLQRKHDKNSAKP